MATYKVPQDVEADDKLIGPFSFRQFIYLIITAMLGLAAWGLAQLFIGLAIIPLPFMALFGTLAFPIRKDQPMEIYLAAMISFYLKPHQRLWDPEGIESLIEISAPKSVEEHRTKDLSQTEAQERLSYLANIVDSQGWAIRGTGGAMGTSMNNDAYLEAQSAEDILDTNTSVARGFDQMMSNSTARMREEAREHMLQATMATTAAPVTPVAAQSAPVVAPPPAEPTITQPISQPTPATPQPPVVNYQQPTYDPYPNIHQSVIQPINDAVHQAAQQPSSAPQPPQGIEETPPSTSDTVVDAGIMNLANNSDDLSIETIAHEAHRLEKKAKEASDEVVISLR